MQPPRSPLRRGLQILRALIVSDGPKSLDELAEAIEANKSTAFRLLETLEEFDLVSRPLPTGGYYLGPACLSLANGFLRNMPLVESSTPILSKLRDDTGETVGLFVTRRHQRICLAAFDSRREVRRTMEAGLVQPLYVGAISKAMLAFLPPSVLENVLAPLPENLVREKDSISKDDFREEITKTRERRYSVSIEETNRDIWGVGVPVLSADDALLAAIAVSGPMSRFPGETLDQLVELARRAASEIATKF